MRRWLVGHSPTRHGVHRYSLEQFGLTPDAIEEAFAGYHERFALALQRLIHLAEASRAWHLAAQYARQALAIDPLAEHFHRRLMVAHYQAGERASALAAYAACESILQAELGVAPDPASWRIDRRSSRAPTSASQART